MAMTIPKRDLGTVESKQSGSFRILLLRNPPLNTLSQGLCRALIKEIKAAEGDDRVKCIILMGHGNHFSAGHNIMEFKEMESGAEPKKPGERDVLNVLDSCSFPTIAAIKGVALGGGCELCLGCDFRVADNTAQIGLPEMTMGLIPGASGTQRLPRLVSVANALKMIMSGTPVRAKEALSMGLVDKVASTGLNSATVIQLASELLQSTNQHPHHRLRSSPPRRNTPEEIEKACFQASLKVKSPTKGNDALWAAIEAVRACASQSFGEGMELEGALFLRLVQSQQSRARRHLFFAERAARHVSGALGLQNSTPPRAIGVVGAGTMGSGITISLLLGGLRVILIDSQKTALQRASAIVKASFSRRVKRGVLSTSQLQDAESRLVLSSTLNSLIEVDMVIEAIFENLSLKQKVFKQLDSICAPHCILCTNTSALDIDRIASATHRPRLVMGMHFFAPAHVNRLVECVKGSSTSLDTIVNVMDVTKRIRKLGVLVGNCFGFVGNRMFMVYINEVLFMLEEGASPRQIDDAVKEFGLPIGPLEVSDIYGNDIGYHLLKEQGLLDPRRRDRTERFCDLTVKICEVGRLGQKTGKGWYRYDKGSTSPQNDPVVDRLLMDYRHDMGLTPRVIHNEEIIERCFFSIVNEGLKILEDRIAERPGDIDVIWVHGYTWPRWRGGPMFWANELGASRILKGVKHYSSMFPNVSHWKPANTLMQMVADGEESVTNWYSKPLARL